MKKGQIHIQLIPEEVHKLLPIIESILQSEIKGFLSDNLREVISIVACHVRSEEDYTPLKMQYIKRLVPQGDKYLNGLMKLGIIQRSGFPIPGQTCYKYKFIEEYQSKYCQVPLHNPRLKRRIEKVQEEFRKESTKFIRGHSEQVKYLKQLTIANGYLEFINSKYIDDTVQYNSVLGSAARIINQDIFYMRDKTSGRFHSNVTNLPKGLRQFLRINNESLINNDIKNSQPYLSTLILTNPGKVSWMTNNPAFALLLQSLKVSLAQDVKKYIELVISGQLYEYLMQEFLKNGLDLSRAETKQQVLRILFAKNRMPKDEVNKKCRLIFKDRFPTVHRIFSKIRGSQKGDKFTNFRRFAILLQRIESYLMLDVILKRIYKELPGTIAVTIHDSIMTGILTNNIEAVKKIMIEELTSFVGFPPKIQTEKKEEKEGEREGEEREERKKAYLDQYDATTIVMLN